MMFVIFPIKRVQRYRLTGLTHPVSARASKSLYKITQALLIKVPPSLLCLPRKFYVDTDWGWAGGLPPLHSNGYHFAGRSAGIMRRTAWPIKVLCWVWWPELVMISAIFLMTPRLYFVYLEKQWELEAELLPPTLWKHLYVVTTTNRSLTANITAISYIWTDITHTPSHRVTNVLPWTTYNLWSDSELSNHKCPTRN